MVFQEICLVQKTPEEQRKKMNFRNALKGLLFICLLLPAGAFAANSVLSGTFDGSESKLRSLPGTCFGYVEDEDDPNRRLGYQEAGTFQVSVSGVYSVLEAYNSIGVDISALIYSGSLCRYVVY